jgi:AraC family transcriptional regulator
MKTDTASSERHPIAQAFRRADAPPPLQTTRVLRRASLVVTEIQSECRDRLVTGTLPQDDAYIVTMHLRRRPKGGMAAEGRWLQTSNFHPGHAGIIDLRMKLVSEYTGPFHYLSFYLTRETLDAFADDGGPSRVGDLRHRPGVGFADPVVRHLLLALRPTLAASPEEMNTVFADHVAMAFATHMARTYGEARPLRPLPRGGLAPWQERRAKEILDARLDGSVSLAELAGACQLSVRHFARAFRQSTGQPPHRWLMERRVERAEGLLEFSHLPMGEIATSCGFASPSHFARAFRQATGTSPGAWRRGRQQ